MDRTYRVNIGWRSVLGVVLLLSLACTSSQTDTAATTSGTSSTKIPDVAPASPTSSFPIPNGTYDTTGTRQEALEAGFSNKEIDKWYGPDGKLPVSLVLADGRYQIFVVGDDGVEELGATATYTATKKLWVAGDESEGCPGCIYTYRWSLHGKVLSLRLVPRLTHDKRGPEDLRGVRLVTEHDYVEAS